MIGKSSVIAMSYDAGPYDEGYKYDEILEWIGVFLFISNLLFSSLILLHHADFKAFQLYDCPLLTSDLPMIMILEKCW